MEWNRENIKNNFLRRIILRVDYEGIVDIKDILKNLESKLPSLGFTERNFGFINNAEFELNDPEMIESELKIPIKELSKIETYKYRNSDGNVELEVNELYSALNVDVNNYNDINKYCNIFSEVINGIKEKSVYLKINRIGLRKINDCIIRDKSRFNDYFDKEYFFDISNKLRLNSIKTEKINTQFVDTFSVEKYMFNYIRIVSGGVLTIGSQNYDVYQAVIDIDGYSYDRELLNTLLGDTNEISNIILELNENLFELYSNSLTQSFKEKLLENEFIDENILGVNKNG